MEVYMLLIFSITNVITAVSMKSIPSACFGMRSLMSGLYIERSTHLFPKWRVGVQKPHHRGCEVNKPQSPLNPNLALSDVEVRGGCGLVLGTLPTSPTSVSSLGWPTMTEDLILVIFGKLTIFLQSEIITKFSWCFSSQKLNDEVLY